VAGGEGDCHLDERQPGLVGELAERVGGLEQILDMVAAIAKIPGDAGYREPILGASLAALRPAVDG